MKKDFGFFITADPELCTGCRACELACFSAHSGNIQGRTVGTLSCLVTPNLHVVKNEQGCSLSACKHCEDAPCMKVCQPKAISRIDHQVIINSELCNGCQDCIPACPFGVISMAAKQVTTPVHPHFSPSELTAFKCDLCRDIQAGPSCVRACPNGALRLLDPEDERQQKGWQAIETLIVSTNL